MIVVQNLAKKVDLKVKMAAMPILLAIGSQGSDTGPLWSSCSTDVPFFPLSVGNKIYRPLSFCSEWGEIPYKTGATCLPWVVYAGKRDPGS